MAYDWSKSSVDGVARPPVAISPPSKKPAGARRFAASEEDAALDAVVGIVGRALATDPVTLAYALPGKEQRYCEAALRAGLLTDSVGRDRRLWLSECGRAAAVAYLVVGGGGGGAASAASSAALLPRPPPLPLLAGAHRAALTATALTSLRPGEPARACARAATALARVRGAYCAAVERSVGGGGGGGSGGGDERDEGPSSSSSSSSSSPSSISCLVAYVSVLAVDPPAQGRGLGTRLLRHVLRELLLGGDQQQQQPVAAAAAHAYVEASSERSAALYERLGFRVIASVDADGGVKAGGGGGGGGREGAERENEGEGEGGGGGGSYYSLPRAPTLVMAAELKGRFREWLVDEEEEEEG